MARITREWTTCRVPRRRGIARHRSWVIQRRLRAQICRASGAVTVTVGVRADERAAPGDRGVIRSGIIKGRVERRPAVVILASGAPETDLYLEIRFHGRCLHAVLMAFVTGIIHPALGRMFQVSAYGCRAGRQWIPEKPTLVILVHDILCRRVPMAGIAGGVATGLFRVACAATI